MFTVKTNYNEFVDNLREEIENKVSRKYFKLYYKGKKLENDKRLSDYDIQNNDTIDLKYFFDTDFPSFENIPNLD